MSRLSYTEVAPAIMAQMLEVEKYLASSGLDKSLLHLIKIRASQINGCVYCLDMHTKDAQADGEDIQRILVLPAWREAPLYTEKERAALALTEAVTLINQGGVSDKVYETALKHFGEKGLADLTMAIVSINSWNRLNVTFKNNSCTYIPRQFDSKEP